TPQTQTSLYRWLIKQSFVQKELHHGYHAYHDLVRDLFCRYLFQSSPEGYYATRRQLVHYYEHHMEQLLERGGQEIYQEEQWLELVLALVQQLFLCPDTASHCAAIERLLDAHDRAGRNEEIIGALRELTQSQPGYLINTDAWQTAQAVLDYLEAEPVSEEFVHAASALIEKAGRTASFSAVLLARLYGLRGYTLRKLNQHHRALNDLSRALALDPNYILAYAQRGITYRDLKQYTEALNDFQSALEANDSLDWVYTARGETYRKIKEYERALADFNCAIELDPDYATAYAGRGRIYHALQEYERALVDFDRAISIDPELEWVYAHRGGTYRQLKQYSHAIADYIKATELNPSYFWAYAQLGETYRQIKNYKRALDAYNSAIEIDPDYAWARASRAFVYFALKDYQHALTDYDRAIAINPDYTWAYGQRGKTYRHLKNYLYAITDFDRALALDPNNAWAYSHRGLCYTSLGDYHQAIADIDRAIELQPQHAQFYGHRGSAYLGLFDLVRGKADYARNCELNPADLRACWTYVWIELCEHRANEATIHRLETIAAREPQHAIAYLCRGMALWFKQRSQRALTELQMTQKLRPTMWDTYFWQGMIVATGGHDDVIQHWKHALELGMPPVLLAPLRWLEETQPEIFHRDAEPLLQSATNPADETM
ncbi:MAG TPA: tetratricopeptide repeat protein, partial [Ktedonobacteraceae bacterium]